MVKTINEHGKETNFYFDSANRLVQTIYPNQDVERVVYDAAGRSAIAGDRPGLRQRTTCQH